MISSDVPSLRRVTTAKRAIVLPSELHGASVTVRAKRSTAVKCRSASADRQASATDRFGDTELHHFRLQRGSLHAESCSGTRRTAHEPLRLLECLANVLALGVFER